MRTLIIVLTTCAFAACSASTRSRVSERTNPAAADSTPARSGHAAVDLTGTWATGSASEPAAREVVLHPQCNYSPAIWIVAQSGDSVRAWNIPESHAQGIATREPASSAPATGFVSGVDLFIGTSGARYLLHFDSASGHLRGTLNGTPFWAVRLEIVRPQGCIAVP